MKLIILSLLIIVSVQSEIYGQVNVKSESEILAGIEWLSTNPVEQTNKEFISKSADYIIYQLVKFPSFQVNFKALTEFMASDSDYKYYDEINIVFTSNQLANKIKSGNKYDLRDSSLISMVRVMEYYKFLIEKEPDQHNSVLDEYSTMGEKDLKTHIIKLLKK